MKKLLLVSLLVGILTVLPGCRKQVPQHGGKTAAQWAEVLRGPDVAGRREAARALGALKGKEHIPDLVKALRDSDEEVRSRAAEALWGIGPAGNEAVQALLSDRNAGARLNVTGALGEMGSPAAVPALRDRLRDPDVYVRAQAATSLGRLKAATKDAVPALVEAMRDRSKDVRVAAVYALGEIGPEARDGQKKTDTGVPTAMRSRSKSFVAMRESEEGGSECRLQAARAWSADSLLRLNAALRTASAGQAFFSSFLSSCLMTLPLGSNTTSRVFFSRVTSSTS